MGKRILSIRKNIFQSELSPLIEFKSEIPKNWVNYSWKILFSTHTATKHTNIIVSIYKNKALIWAGRLVWKTPFNQQTQKEVTNLKAEAEGQVLWAAESVRERPANSVEHDCRALVALSSCFTAHDISQLGTICKTQAKNAGRVTHTQLLKTQIRFVWQLIWGYFDSNVKNVNETYDFGGDWVSVSDSGNLTSRKCGVVEASASRFMCIQGTRLKGEHRSSEAGLNYLLNITPS